MSTAFAGQLEQAPEPSEAATVLLRQNLHVALEVAPSVADAKPAGQEAHAVDFATKLYVPAMQRARS